MSGYLRQLTPATLVVFYLRDVKANDLVAVHASGYGADLVAGLRMPLGKNVSGWVAVNGQSISTDPALDGVEGLGDIDPRFGSLLSVALRTDQSTIGVATLYAVGEQRVPGRATSGPGTGGAGDCRGPRRARSSPMRRCLDLESPDDVAGVASRQSLEQLLARDRRRSGATGRARAVLCLKNEGDPGVMLHAMMAVSQSTRIADLIFRPTDDSLVVLMKDADASAEPLVLQRIAAALPADIVAAAGRRLAAAPRVRVRPAGRRVLERPAQHRAAPGVAHAACRRARPGDGRDRRSERPAMDSVSLTAAKAGQARAAERTGFSGLPPLVQLGVALVALSGAAATAAGLVDLPLDRWPALLGLLAFSLAAAAARVPVPLNPGASGLSWCYVANILSVVLVGTWPSVPLAVAGAWGATVLRTRDARSWYRTVFTLGSTALSVLAAGLVYQGCAICCLPGTGRT